MKFSGFVFAAEDRYSHAERYAFLYDVADYLDRNGFDALWTPERHFQEFGGCFPNPAVLSAALAARTQRLKLRAGSVVAPHHHPVRIAEEWALVDQLSGGRAGVCFAAGWHKRDFVFYPENFQDRKALMFERIETVRALWAGESRRFHAAEEDVDVRIYPRPVQPDIPLWLVYSNDPAIWVRAGELGLNVLALLNTWTTIADGIASYRQARERAGHDPRSGVVTLGLHTFVGENDRDVRRLVEAPLKHYLSSFLLAKNDDKQLRSERAPMTEGEKAMILEGAFNDLFESRSLLGDVDKCERVVRRLQSIGVDEVAALIDFGVGFSDVLRSLAHLKALKDRFQPAGPAASDTAAPCGDGEAAEEFAWYFNR